MCYFGLGLVSIVKIGGRIRANLHLNGLFMQNYFSGAIKGQQRL